VVAVMRGMTLRYVNVAAGAVYISTEDVFPNKRLQQLTELFARKCRQPGLSAQLLSDNIYVEHAATIVRKFASCSTFLPSRLPSFAWFVDVSFPHTHAHARTCTHTPQTCVYVQNYIICV